MQLNTITKEEQLKELLLVQKRCLINAGNYIPEPGYCPYFYDGVICWSPTRASSTAYLPCPSYINGLRKRGLVSRDCLENSTWFNYTNFDNCMSKNVLLMQCLNYIGHAGYSLSFLSLGISILIMRFFKRLSCPRNTIHTNVFFSFLIRAILHFLNLIVPSKILWLCRSVYVMQYFSITASHTWISIEALFLHNTLMVHLMGDNSPYLITIYTGIGWGIPAILGITWSVLKYIYENKECWQVNFDFYQRIHWLELLYPIFTTIVNLGLFINITRVVYMKATDRNQGLPTNRYRKLLKATAILVIVFGIYDVVMIPLVLLSAKISSESFETVRLYYEHIMTSCQGFFVALLFCFINSEVINELRRFYRQRKNLRHRNPYNFQTNSSLQDLNCTKPLTSTLAIAPQRSPSHTNNTPMTQTRPRQNMSHKNNTKNNTIDSNTDQIE